jgi:hypothetical protein
VKVICLAEELNTGGGLGLQILNYIASRTERLKDLAGALFMAVLPFLQNWLMWYPPADSRHTLTGDFMEHFGARGYWYSALKEGRLPLWDHMQDVGLPYFGYMFDLANPIILLNIFLLDEGYMRNYPSQVMMISHFAISGVGAYLMGLSLGLGRIAALVLGLVWASNGHILIKNVGHDLAIHTSAWVPYVFMFLERARQKLSWLNAAWAGFFLGMLFIAGHPQYFYMVMILLACHLIYWFCIWSNQHSPGWAVENLVRIWLPMGVMSILIASPHLAHHIGEVLGGLPKVAPSHDLGDLVFTSKGSGKLSYLPYFITPTLEGGYVETFNYPGVIPLILAVFGLVYLRRYAVGFWKVLLLVTMVLMLGNTIGLHKWLIDTLPGYIMFRENRRYLLFSHLALGVLAAYAVAWIMSHPKADQVKRLANWTGGFSGLLLAAVLLIFSIYHFNAQSLDGANLVKLLNAFLAALLLAGAAWLIFARTASQGMGPGMRLLLICLIALDLGFYQLPFTAYQYKDLRPDRSLVSQHQEQRVARALELTQDGPSRFGMERTELNLQAAYKQGLMLVRRLPPHVERLFSRDYWEIRWRFHENPRFIDLFGVSHMTDHLKAERIRRESWTLCNGSQSAVRLNSSETVTSIALKATANDSAGQSQGAVLAWLGLVKDGALLGKWPLRLGMEIKGEQIALPLAEPLKADELLLASRGGHSLVEIGGLWINQKRAQDRTQLINDPSGFKHNPNALPLAFFVSRGAVVPERPLYERTVVSVDPARVVLFRKPPPGFEPPKGLSSAPGGKAGMISFAPERVEVEYEAGRPGYLIMSQTKAHGWTAALDGREASLIPAYGFMCAIKAPPGKHRVVFSFDQPLVRAGLIISPLSFLGLVALSIWLTRKKALSAAP